MVWKSNQIDIFLKITKEYEDVDLHPTRLAGRAAAGQPGGVQVHIFISFFVIFRKMSIY